VDIDLHYFQPKNPTNLSIISLKKTWLVHWEHP